MDPDLTSADRNSSNIDQTLDQEPQIQDHVFLWVPSGRGLISGLVGLNVVLLGGALLAGSALNEDILHRVSQLLLLCLMGLSVGWMVWFLIWDSKRPGYCPHKDHHAGGVTVKLVLLLFAAFSLFLCIFRASFLITMRHCKSADQLVSPFIEALFLCVQTYLLWAHSKYCIHTHKMVTRAGLMVTLCVDLLLWLKAVTEDTIHQEIELEKQDSLGLGNVSITKSSDTGGSNSSLCQCSANAACLIFRKGFEVLYPFSMEFYLMAGCMLYVLWKNVGRPLSTIHHHVNKKLTLRFIYQGGIVYGPVFGALVLTAGITVFILYQLWVSNPQLRLTAFVLIYGYHLAVLPIMSFCSLLGLLVHRFERRAHEGTHNPTRSLDVLLLVAAALGQLALSYFSLVAALAVGTRGLLGGLDLSYSLLCLLELFLQNIFIIEGLHRHPNLKAKKKDKERSSLFRLKKKVAASKGERKTDIALFDKNTTAPENEGKKPWTKTMIQEVSAFLILSNIMLWVIPAFGVHPQFENGLGKQFFGFSAWFILVNMGQPLSVFYRMHSVGALMELLLAA